MPKFLKDPQASLWKKLMVILGIVYVISPFDILPDPVLGLGFVDDAVLIAYMVSKIFDELEKYAPEGAKGKFDRDKVIDHVEYKIDDE
ncbi:YkvA family protein [Thermotalea metallivorans]|uniref:YkvA family protein n=1 Tax=Thermotalea metallivorans TaxID=520762 RepID=UPI0018DB0EC3|nr:DUF1232 domain-containing protein [Thermotalea metallivorans]